MTRDEKINALIDNTMDNWGSARDFDNFVKEMLKNGIRGFEDLSDEEIDEEYKSTFEGD